MQLQKQAPEGVPNCKEYEDRDRNARGHDPDHPQKARMLVVFLGVTLTESRRVERRP